MNFPVIKMIYKFYKTNSQTNTASIGWKFNSISDLVDIDPRAALAGQIHRVEHLAALHAVLKAR